MYASAEPFRINLGRIRLVSYKNRQQAFRYRFKLKQQESAPTPDVGLLLAERTALLAEMGKLIGGAVSWNVD